MKRKEKLVVKSTVIIAGATAPKWASRCIPAHFASRCSIWLLTGKMPTRRKARLFLLRKAELFRQVILRARQNRREKNPLNRDEGFVFHRFFHYPVANLIHSA